MKKYLILLACLVFTAGINAFLTNYSQGSSLSANVANIFVSHDTKTTPVPTVPHPKLSNPTCLEIQNQPIPASGWPAGSTAPVGGSIILNIAHVYAPTDCRVKITGFTIAIQTSGPQPSSILHNLMLTNGIMNASGLANGITSPNGVNSFPTINGGITLNPFQGTWVVTSASLVGGSGNSVRVGLVGISGYYPSTNKSFFIPQSQWGSWIAVQ